MIRTSFFKGAKCEVIANSDLFALKNIYYSIYRYTFYLLVSRIVSIRYAEIIDPKCVARRSRTIEDVFS